jgi:hypothetical protein
MKPYRLGLFKALLPMIILLIKLKLASIKKALIFSTSEHPAIVASMHDRAGSHLAGE